MVTVRPATIDDGRGIAAIDRAVWSEAHSPGPQPKPDATAFHGDRIVVESTVVAIDAGEVVGWTGWFRPSPLDSNAHVRQITGLATAPSHRRLGVATLLLDAAAARCRDLGATKLRLRVLATNDAGRRLYERYGFVEEGRLRGEFVLAGEPVDDLFLALDLTG